MSLSLIPVLLISSDIIIIVWYSQCSLIFTHIFTIFVSLNFFLQSDLPSVWSSSFTISLGECLLILFLQSLLILKCLCFNPIFEKHFFWTQYPWLPVIFIQHIEFIFPLASDFYCFFWEVNCQSATPLKIFFFNSALRSFLFYILQFHWDAWRNKLMLFFLLGIF